MRVSVMGHVINNDLSRALLQANVAGVSGTDIGGFDAGSRSPKKVIGDLVHKWIIPGAFSRRLTARHGIKSALAGGTGNEKAVFKGDGIFFASFGDGEACTAKHGPHGQIAI